MLVSFSAVSPIAAIFPRRLVILIAELLSVHTLVLSRVLLGEIRTALFTNFLQYSLL